MKARSFFSPHNIRLMKKNKSGNPQREEHEGEAGCSVHCSQEYNSTDAPSSTPS